MTDRIAQLADEFAIAAAKAERRHFAALEEQGVDARWLWGGAMRFGVAPIRLGNGEIYEPDPEGPTAFIVPALPLGAPWDAHFLDDDVGDLIAWLPADPRRWWCRFGSVPLLNPDAIEAARWFKRPLSLWATPLGWLRAAGEGAVIVSRCDFRLWLGGLVDVRAETRALGEKIERGLREPPVQMPKILVPKRAA